MSNINFTCPHCSFQKKLPASAEGMQGNCPNCNAVATITADAPANPPVSHQQPLAEQPLPEQTLPEQPLPEQPVQKDMKGVEVDNQSAGILDKLNCLIFESTSNKDQTEAKSEQEQIQSEREQVQTLIDESGLPSFYGNTRDLYERRAVVMSQWETRDAIASSVNKCVALTACLLFGMVGGHRAYLGYKSIALAYNSALGVLIFFLFAPLFITGIWGVTDGNIVFSFFCTIVCVVVLIALHLAILIDYVLIATGLVQHEQGGTVPWLDAGTDVKAIDFRIVWIATTVVASIIAYFIPFFGVALFLHIGLCVVAVSHKKIVPIVALFIVMVLLLVAGLVQWLQVVSGLLDIE